MRMHWVEMIMISQEHGFCNLYRKTTCRNGHDDEIRVAEVSEMRELDLVEWIRVGC